MSAATAASMSAGKLLKSILLFVIVLIVAILAALTWLSRKDNAVDYQVSLDGLVLPEFDSQQLNFIPSYDKTQTLPFTASAIVDVNNDGVEELFLGGGMNQQDAFFAYQDGEFKDISQDVGWTKQFPDKTFSAVSLDLDVDGDNDMLITRQSGVWKYTNANGRYEGVKLELDIDSQTVPLSLGVADLNRDGHFDLFVAGYIARKHVQGETIFNQEYGGVSALYLNNGDDTFENITSSAGMDYKHNTFLGIFIDVDGDGLEDLMVAHDTGQIRSWKNMGNLKFENKPNPSSGVYAYPMGIAITDYGNDERPDFWFSNVGSTTPDFLVRGDLRDDQILHKKWFMFENKGDFVFDDIAESVKLADYEFSWGAVFEDFNLDGRDDLVVSENYTGWPLHGLKYWRLDGRFLLQNEAGEFAEISDAIGMQNREFGITPLSADFNQDGYPDLVHVNLLGPQYVHISTGGDQGFLKVKLPNTVASIGAVISVTLDDGATLNQIFVVGEGLVSDQSHIQIFGLGKRYASEVRVRYLDGTEIKLSGNFRNETVTP